MHGRERQKDRKIYSDERVVYRDNCEEMHVCRRQSALTPKTVTTGGLSFLVVHDEDFLDLEASGGEWG